MPSARLLDAHHSASNTRYLVGLADGASVEAVLYRADSLCVSSQVGCAVGCPFCASGANGLARNLELDELIAQVQAVRPHAAGLKRITVSGVGEPLHNLKAVGPFISWCAQEELPVSLTTSGGPVRRLGEMMALPHRGLTFSVHAGTEPVRAQAVPGGPPLERLFAELTKQLETLSSTRKRKLALAYLVIADLNDADAEIEAFLKRALPLELKIHLYSYNPVPTSSHRAVSEARYQQIFQRMRDTGADVRRSSQARVDRNGGCGTLVALRSRAP